MVVLSSTMFVYIKQCNDIFELPPFQFKYIASNISKF